MGWVRASPVPALVDVFDVRIIALCSELSFAGAASLPARGQRVPARGMWEAVGCFAENACAPMALALSIRWSVWFRLAAKLPRWLCC